MIPPLWLTIKIIRPECRNIKLWLPLFLIWPFMLIFAILLLPIVLLIAIFQLIFRHHIKILLFLPLMCNVLCRLRGLLVDVNNPGEKVYIHVR
jgi:hypothetical protein